MNNFDEIEKLWFEFRTLPYPSGLAGEEVKGIDVTDLDTFTAGCIDTFVSGKGRLDGKRKSILIECQEELKVVVPNVEGAAKTYFEKLLILVGKILQSVEMRAS